MEVTCLSQYISRMKERKIELEGRRRNKQREQKAKRTAENSPIVVDDNIGFVFRIQLSDFLLLLRGEGIDRFWNAEGASERLMLQSDDLQGRRSVLVLEVSLSEVLQLLVEPLISSSREIEEIASGKRSLVSKKLDGVVSRVPVERDECNLIVHENPVLSVEQERMHAKFSSKKIG